MLCFLQRTPRHSEVCGSLNALVVMLASAYWVTAVPAADWPQWGGTDARNMASGEKGIPATFEPGKKLPRGQGIDPATTRNVRWTYRLGGDNYSSPAITRGRVYIGTNDTSLGDPRLKPTGGGSLLCLDEATGKLLWRLVVPRLCEGRHSKDFDRMQLGICSSPTVDGNRVYVLSNRAEVICLDVQGMADSNQGPFLEERRHMVEPSDTPIEPGPKDADILWCFDMRTLPIFPHDAASCSVLVHGDFVYVVTGNGVDDLTSPFPLAPSLIVLDKHTGRLVAKDDERIGTRVYHGQWSSPSLGTVGGKDLVFFGAGDGVCYAFEALGRESPRDGYLHKVWTYDCNSRDYRYRGDRPIDYWEGDKREKRGNKNDGLFKSPCEIIGTPVFTKGRVFVTIGQDPLHGRGRGMLSCIDASKTGDISSAGKIWSYDGIDRSLSTVAIADGLVYAADMPGRLHCLDAETGKCYWVFETKSDTWSSPFAVDGKVYLGTRKCLWVFAAGKEPKVLAQIRLGTQVRSTPVAANGTLYVASQGYLWAVGDPAGATGKPDLVGQQADRPQKSGSRATRAISASRN